MYSGRVKTFRKKHTKRSRALYKSKAKFEVQRNAQRTMKCPLCGKIMNGKSKTIPFQYGFKKPVTLKAKAMVWCCDDCNMYYCGEEMSHARAEAIKAHKSEQERR